MSEDKDVLDFSSESFDAAEALENPSTAVPVPEAPTFDNLSQFISSMKNRKTGDSDATEVTRPVASAGRSGAGRNFLPHQQPVVGRGRGRPQRNVLTRMAEVTHGPLAVLRRCMQNKTRVKVWIRGAAWIRGYCTGFVAAFDKQWNLALTDVDEVFTRPRKRKSPIYGDVEHVACRLGSMTTADDKDHVEEEEVVQEKGVKTPMNEDGADSQSVAPERHDFDANVTASSGRQSPLTEMDRICQTSQKTRQDRSPPPPLAARDSRQNRQPRESLTGVTMKKSFRTHELCQRHVHQLFVRGEQIALVAVL